MSEEAGTMRCAIVLVDVLSDFAHDDGEALCTSYSSRFPGLERLVGWAREEGLPIVYANDALGEERCCRETVVARALAGPLGHLIERIAPRPEDPVFVKPLYSGFEQTGLEALLRRHRIDTLIVAGAATERCVAQTITSARERHFDCFVVEDACATVDVELEHIAHAYLARVAEATIVRSDDVCDAQLGRARAAVASVG